MRKFCGSSCADKFLSVKLEQVQDARRYDVCHRGLAYQRGYGGPLRCARMRLVLGTSA